MTRKSSRRAFLRGQSAVNALQDAAERLVGDEAFELPPPEQHGYLVRIGRRAMACEFEVLLNAKQYPQGTEAAVAALDLVDELESQLSVYRDDSEISRLNRTAHEQPVQVEPRLFALLQRAAEIYRHTGGAHDITAGPLAKTWGFHRRAGRMPNEAELADTLQSVGLKYVEFDHVQQTVKFTRPGVEINLGSIGKGYALDRVAELLEASGIENFLLHGGNSSVLARGSNVASHHDAGEGWWVGLRHPLRPEKRLGQICLQNRALGTSGSGTQFFIHEGRRLGHILDPRTGWPTEGVLSTTVAAPTGADADALATAFYVLGIDGTLDYCRQHPGVSAVVMSPGSAAGQVTVVIWNLTDDEIRVDADESLTIHRVTE